MDEPDTRDNLQNKEQEPLAHLQKISYILLGIAGVITLIGTIYVVRTPPAEEKHTLLLLAAGAVVLSMVAISFVLGELSEGQKTVKEAVITVIIEMAMLGLFILISNLLRK